MFWTKMHAIRGLTVVKNLLFIAGLAFTPCVSHTKRCNCDPNPPLVKIVPGFAATPYPSRLHRKKNHSHIALSDRPKVILI